MRKAITGSNAMPALTATVGALLLSALTATLVPAGVANAAEPRNARQYIARGQQQFNAGNHGAAMADYSRAIELNPGAGNAWAMRGELRINYFDASGALADLDRAVELMPRSYIPYLYRSWARLALGDFQGAAADAGHALERRPARQHRPYILLRRYLARELSGDLGGAREDWVLLNRLDPQLAASSIAWLPPGALRLTASIGTRMPAGGASRPLWHFGILRQPGGQRQTVWMGVQPDGQPAALLGGGRNATWSPRGDELAWLSFHDSRAVVWIGNQNGTRPVSLQLYGNVAGWQLAWSPDSTRVAFVLAGPGATPGERVEILTIVDVTEGRLVAQHRLPAGTLAGFPAATAPPDQLSWSPDGRRILVSWGKLVVVDVAGGGAQTLAGTPAPAAWAPGSDAVYYLGMRNVLPGERGWSGLFYRQLDQAAPVLLADPARLAALGLADTAVNYGLLRLSPGGSRLALGGGMTTPTAGTLLVFSTTATGGLDLDNPVARIQGGILVALAWAPDESGLATISLARTPRVPLSGQPIDVTVDMVTLADSTTRTINRYAIFESVGELEALGYGVLAW